MRAASMGFSLARLNKERKSGLTSVAHALKNLISRLPNQMTQAPNSSRYGKMSVLCLLFSAGL